MSLAAKDRIFVAIDVDTLEEAKQIMDQCVGLVSNVKVGLQLATRESWATVVAAAKERSFKVFCDAKFKDIPNTVDHATYALTLNHPDYFTVMADNNLAALQAARSGADRAAKELSVEPPRIIGVTVLTSISPEESQQIYGADARDKVLQFGANAVEAGLDAIVCSPKEVALFRADDRFKDTLLITPGVRPDWAAGNDQARSMTPAEAIKAGADMLVVGRPITQPPAEVGSPAEAIKRIIAEIEEN